VGGERGTRFFAALRMTTGMRGMRPAGDEGPGGAEPRPYGFCMSAEIILRRAESPRPTGVTGMRRQRLRRIYNIR
jgi:hypothetical protein